MDPVKAEKEQAMLRYHRLRQAATLSRWLLEALAVLALLFWSSDRLPTVLAVSAAILRRLPTVIFHPASAFLIGNIIVVTLFAKSGGHSFEDLSPPLPPPPSDGAKDARDQRHHCPYFLAIPLTQLHRAKEAEEVVVYEDKAVCVESTTTPAAVSLTTYNSVTTTAGTSHCKGSQKCLLLPRTRSSTIPGEVAGLRERLLRRSETDVDARRGVAERWWRPEEEAEEEGRGRKASVAEDDNEDFRRRIEAFISKQLCSIEREEESLLLTANGAIVVVAGGPDHDRRR